jgi:glycosyltransferase involved in cell wall biosynthesis
VTIKLTLIITTYNREDALLAVLETVLTQTQLPDEIVVADDGSKKPTEDAINSFKQRSPIPVIHAWQEDSGFRAARIRNMAIVRSSGEYLVFIDGDILLDRHFIADHYRNAQPGLFIQGGRLLLSPEKTEDILQEQKEAASFSLLSNGVSGRHKMVHSDTLSALFSQINSKTKGSRTCNFALWRSDALKVNGFNEDFQGWGREDSEFVIRLFFSGLKRKKLAFNAIGFHLHHPLQSREALEANDEIIRQTSDSKESRCKSGINNHLSDP